MNASEERTGPARPAADTDAELDLGTEAGARLGAPPPDWRGGDHSGGGTDRGSGGAGRGGVPKRLLRGAVTVLAAVGFAAVLWYAYLWGVGDEGSVELPVVRAETGPEKVKPEDPGGLQVPYQDQLVLDRESGEGTVRVERLLPPPEVPLPVAPAGGESESAAPAPDIAEIEPAGIEPAGIEPEVIETAAAPDPSPAPAAPDPTPAPAAPDPSPAPAAPAAAAEPAEAPQVAEVLGTFVLQLASFKTPKSAERERTRLKTAYPDLLSGLSFFIQAADVENIGRIHRLQIGTFPTRSTAADFCAELKNRKQDCFIVQR